MELLFLSRCNLCSYVSKQLVEYEAVARLRSCHFIKNGIYNLYHPSKGLIAHTNMSTNHMLILLNESSNNSAPIQECLDTSSN